MKKLHYWNQISNFKKQLLAFCFADVFATPFRLPFEVRKMFIQMNAGPISFNKYINAMKISLLPSIIRDFSFRLGFNITYQFCLHGQNYINYYSNSDDIQRELLKINIEKSQASYDKKIAGMILGSLV
ncbi:mitochondrial carrier protein, putative, partial [Ichthyophthirius multifiliis]